jgi:hypothetical protein
MIKGLTLLLIYLRLTHQVDWSWWVIFTPYVVDFLATCIMNVYLERQKKDAEEKRKTFQELVEERMNKHKHV